MVMLMHGAGDTTLPTLNVLAENYKFRNLQNISIITMCCENSTYISYATKLNTQVQSKIVWLQRPLYIQDVWPRTTWLPPVRQNDL